MLQNFFNFIGASCSGRTNALLALVLNPNGLKFSNLYICSNTLEQEKYAYLQRVLRPIDNMGFHTFSNLEAMVDPSQVKRDSIVIFDDVICDSSQSKVNKFYCVGRHQGVSIFLTQSYTRLNHHLIRANCNILILFKVDELCLRHVFQDFSIACDMSFNQFHDFCINVWKIPFSFVVIDTTSTTNDGKYRSGFDNFLNLNEDRETT